MHGLSYSIGSGHAVLSELASHSRWLCCRRIGRKYLDALCVFFWATTPVLISIITFTTYSLMGNQLTAATVFTSVALFNMLIGPLNAFPWVLNGLVEVSCLVLLHQNHCTQHEHVAFVCATNITILSAGCAYAKFAHPSPGLG